MQHKTLSIALSALLLACAGPSLAQVKPSTETSGARHQHRAQHQHKLKDNLQLRADQQAAWDSYRQAMERRHPMGPRAQRSEPGQQSTPERIARMQAMQAERTQAMNQRLQAVQDFYDQLDAEQKTVFDQHGQRAHKGKRGHIKRGHRGAKTS